MLTFWLNFWNYKYCQMSLEVHTLTTTVVIRTLGKQIHCEFILDYIELKWCQQQWGFVWSGSTHRKLLCPKFRHSTYSFLRFIFMVLVGIYSHPHWNYSKTKILLAVPGGAPSPICSSVGINWNLFSGKILAYFSELAQLSPL